MEVANETCMFVLQIYILIPLYATRTLWYESFKDMIGKKWRNECEKGKKVEKGRKNIGIWQAEYRIKKKS